MTSITEFINHQFYLKGKGQQRLSKQYKVTSPSAAPTFFEIDTTRCFGMDISGAYDGVVDWVTFYKYGGRFAFIKAVDGILHSELCCQLGGGKSGGSFTRPYFWLYPNACISGGGQARAWWQAVQNDPGELPGMIDMEWTMWLGKQNNPQTNDLYGAAVPYAALAGRNPMIYSAPGYLAQYFVPSSAWLSYPLVIANYGVIQPPAVQPWGTNWTFWQAADTGHRGLCWSGPSNSRRKILIILTAR